MRQCYACRALIIDGQSDCAACGARQSAEALEAHRAVRAARASVERTRVLAVAAVIVAFGIGLALGSFRAGPAGPANEPPGADVADLPIEHMNDLFLRSINDALALGATGWIWGADSTFVLELVPPTPTRPTTLWQHLSPTERQEMMAYLGVQYTRALLVVGREVSVPTRGHPPIALRYRDHPGVLAVRERSGAVKVFRSPFDESGLP